MKLLAMFGALLALSVPVAGRAAAEAPGVSAKRFVDRVYGITGPDVSEDAMYTPALAQLIARANVVAGRTDDPDLVGNILCDCSNLSELKARTTLVSASASAASVRVRLTGGVDGPATFLIQLTRLPAGWRIADAVADGGGPFGGSYVRYLRASIRGQ